MECVNFLPRRLKLQRRRRRRAMRQAVVLAASACALGALGYWRQTEVTAARADLACLKQQQGQLEERLAALPALTEQLAAGQVKQRISRELGSRLTINAVLAELSRRLPPAVSLTGISYSTVEMQPEDPGAGVPARPGRPAGKDLKIPPEKRVRVVITGLAPTDLDVANAVAQLSACPLFSNAAMGYAKTVAVDKDRRKASSFQVSCLMAR